MDSGRGGPLSRRPNSTGRSAVIPLGGADGPGGQVTSDGERARTHGKLYILLWGRGGLLRPPPDCPNPVLTLKICRPVLLDAVCNPLLGAGWLTGTREGQIYGVPLDLPHGARCVSSLFWPPPATEGSPAGLPL